MMSPNLLAGSKVAIFQYQLLDLSTEHEPNCIAVQGYEKSYKILIVTQKSQGFPTNPATRGTFWSGMSRNAPKSVA